MFSKATFFVAFVAIAQVSYAAVPGCLLGAINGYDKPADVKAVCQSKDANTLIRKFCGDSTSDALSAFAEVCNNAGVKVSTDIVSGSASGSATATGSVKPTGTGATLPTATNSGAGNSTGNSAGNSTSNDAAANPSGTTSGGAPVNTGAAGKLEVGTAALFAGFGLLAAAL